MIKRFKFAVTLLWGLFILPVLPAWAGNALKIDDAWVRAAPPTVQALAGYMTITNEGPTGKTIDGAYSPQFAKVEFHETLIRNGMATMVARDSLVIGQGSRIVLKPGGYHMMLIAPQRLIREGDKINLVVHFSDQTTQTIVLDVRKGSSRSSSNNSNMMHHAMPSMGHGSSRAPHPMNMNMDMDGDREDGDDYDMNDDDMPHHGHPMDNDMSHDMAQ